ncbi:hypothetical protein KC354_g8920 [Hortaea werneckii]|nr:hypothetical protein KC354_g8920 [Hortaea werneckii]
MDILETNCLTQLSQSARREALPTEYEDDFSDMTDEDTLEEDERILDYLDLDDPHLIDILYRLQDFQIGIFAPMRASSRQMCEYFEELSEEVVHAHNDPGSFPTEETVIDDVARVSVIRTQLPDIESVYLYDKTESRHNHIQQKLTAVHGDVTYVPGRATFISEDAWSLATTASMLRRQYSALSERRVFLVKRLGFWTIAGMRMMARPSAWDEQQWDQVL